MDPIAPPPSGFEVPAPGRQGDMIPLASERGSIAAAPETAVQPAAPALPSAAVPPLAMGPPAAVPPPITIPIAPPTQAAQTANPDVASDIDLIEKAWVDKAKAIVAETRTDPYNQNDQMNRFKADYMKKRYNKDIKIEK